MKRNWDVIREILTVVEETPPDAHTTLTSFPEERGAEISYHTELLFDAGLLDGKMIKHLGPGPYDFFVLRLTWQGHEFLDSIRSDTVWKKAKASFIANGVSMTFDLVKSVATDIAASLIKSSLGTL